MSSLHVSIFFFFLLKRLLHIYTVNTLLHSRIFFPRISCHKIFLKITTAASYWACSAQMRTNSAFKYELKLILYWTASGARNQMIKNNKCVRTNVVKIFGTFLLLFLVLVEVFFLTFSISLVDGTSSLFISIQHSLIAIRPFITTFQ